MIEQVLVYEIKSSANPNFNLLFSDDKKYFHWNNTTFKNLNIGDYVFVVNTHSKQVLFTKLDKADIPITKNDNDQTVFVDLGKQYDVSGNYSTFIRLSIIAVFPTTVNWKWKSFGNSETTYLNGKRIDINKSENRLLNIKQLKELSQDQEYNDVLDFCMLNFTSGQLKKEIIEAIESELIQKLISEKEFHFQKAQLKFIEFEALTESQPGVFKDLLDDFINSKKAYKEFVTDLETNSEQYKIMLIIGQMISYCDQNAAGKKELNEYEDKRTLAKSFVRQPDWVKSLLNFKVNTNDINVLPPSIKNAIAYLKDPSTCFNMLSENHRAMVSKYLLRQSNYDQTTFPESLKKYFLPYNIDVTNNLNLTNIIITILYVFPSVKNLWFEKLGGVVVCDNTGWIENAIKEKGESKYIALWWDKSPSGGEKVLGLLKEAISNSEEKSFYIYYTIKKSAYYRARIVDFSAKDEYSNKDWNKNNDVAWYYPDFTDYKEIRSNGSEKNARIIFLADLIEKLSTPIEVSNFDFYKGLDPPRQNNMQPYTEINFENIEIENTQVMKTTKEIIQHAHNYITSKGFKYKYEEIANFYLALRAKPFVILAGISGTGKTQLPKKFAESLGFSKEQIIQLPVRPDWTDSSDLLGYTSLDGNFKPKDLTIAIQKAMENPDKPYFFILDEMNLARVEHYLSDFLSIIETRNRENGSDIITTDSILREEVLFSALNSDKFQALGWPQNMFLIGTVNMDETTHAFSKKVLDRANSIEMNDVDLDWLTVNKVAIQNLTDISFSYFRTDYITSTDLLEDEKESIKDEMQLLKDINKILQQADLHFAYRIRDEIAFYLTLNNKNNLIDNQIAIDFQLVQKILPRIHGSSERVQTVLIELFNLLEGKSFRSKDFEFSMLEGKIDENTFKFKRASKKIIFMLKRFDDDRFTSFWL